MNAISKKLLSMLVVVAMVLSMVPFGALSVFAAETETEAAATATVTPGQANLPEGVQEIIDEAAKVVNTDEAIDAHIAAGTCPMCGATGITWERKTAGTTLAGTQDQVVHVYYDSELTISGNVLAMYTANSVTSQNNTLCVALKSAAVITNSSVRFMMASGTNNVFNIMGSGSVTTAVGEGTDYGMFQINSGTVNLYGGTYVLDDADGTLAAARVVNGVLNIFNDATIGPETVDTTKAQYNLLVSGTKSVVNMYGGTIRNGVAIKNGVSGNVTVASNGTFNLYGGTISGGQYLAGTAADGTTISSPASNGGNVLVGGLAENATSSSAGNFYMYGGTVTGGKAYNGGHGGGNINIYNADAKLELLGGTVSNGWGKTLGGNVHIQNGTAKIGGTVLITNGYAPSGGNISIYDGKSLTMEGGYITGGELATSDKNATNGGAVWVKKGATFNMTGGTIDGCTASGSGGNIYSAGGIINVGADAVIKDGLSKTASNGGGGGNVYLAVSGNGSTMTTSGTITGGTVDGGSSMQSSGGNISVVASGAIQSTLTVNGGTIADGSLAYGTAGSSFGANIRAYNCKVVINDGLIYGGTTGTAKNNSSIGVQGGTSSSANTDCTLEINGGVIVGDIVAGTYGKPSGTTTSSSDGTKTYTYTCSLKLTGSPKIVTSYQLEDGTTVKANYGGLSFYDATPYDISGLSADAQIVVTGSAGRVFTAASENAATVAGAFSCSNSALIVELQSDNTLKLVEKPAVEPEVGVFQPWNCDGMAYCDACIKLGVSEEDALVAWEVLEDGTEIPVDSNGVAHYHYYLAEDLNYTSDYAFSTNESVCLNLNGYGVTPNTDATGKPTFSSTQKFNLFNTGAEAIVYGNPNQSAGAGSVVNENGGKASATFRLFDNVVLKSSVAEDDNPLLGIGGNGGTIEIYGGTVDASNLTVTTYPSAIMMHGSTGGTYSGNAVVNMRGGKIIGGTSTGNGGAIRVGSTVSETETVSYIGVATFNMYGGEITGGTAQGGLGGGNIYVSAGELNIYGGTIEGGETTNTAGNGGNIFIDYKRNYAKTAYIGGEMNMSGGTVKNGTAAANGAELCVNNNCVLNMSGGEIIGGTAGNQGGIMRVWKGEVHMSGDAKMYAGTAKTSLGIWLVCSDMTMTDNAVVYGIADSTAAGNAINVASWGNSASDVVVSTLTLSGNATVKSPSGESKNSIVINWTLNNNADATDDTCSQLIVTNDWAGEAYVHMTKNVGVAEEATKSTLEGYQRGETIANATAVCGSITDGTFTKGGSYTGKLYYGPANNAQLLGVEGDVVVGLVAIRTADGEIWYGSNAEAVAAYNEMNGFASEAYIILGNEGEIVLDGDAYVDSRGYDTTVSGTGTLYAMDNANDDYVGYGSWYITSADVEVATDVENAVKDRRYIVVDMDKDDAGNRVVTAHRLEMGLSAVSLRTAQAGLYYKAAISCDGTLAARVSAYGVVLSVNDMPGADFIDVPTDGFSCYETGFEVNADNNYTVSATSGAVFGIFKSENRTADQNAEYGKMKIYANTYIMVDTQGDESADNDVALVGDTTNPGTQNGNAYSLFDVLKAIDSNWAEYADAQAQVTEFYNEWAELGMNQYADEFENIA